MRRMILLYFVIFLWIFHVYGRDTMTPLSCISIQNDSLLNNNIGLVPTNNETVIINNIESIFLIDSLSTNFNLISIFNQTERDYYLWVSPTNIDSLSVTHKIRRYLWRSIKGFDLNLGTLLFDPNVSFSDYNFFLGYNFIKKLSPYSCFTFYLSGNEDTVYDYEKRLVIVSEDDLVNIIKNTPPIDDFFLYPENEAIIGRNYE